MTEHFVLRPCLTDGKRYFTEYSHYIKLDKVEREYCRGCRGDRNIARYVAELKEERK